MSDIRFNQWLHQSGTGGVSQVASGAVGVGTTNPLADFYVRGDAQITGILTAGHIAMGSSITFGDDDRAYFGDGTDLQIYHSGSHSFIQDTGTGNLFIDSNSVQIRNAVASKTTAKFIENAQVELYYNNTERIRTTNTGAVVTGVIETTVDGADNMMKIKTSSSGNPILQFNAVGSGGHDIEYIRSTNTLNFKQAGGSVRLSITAAGHLLPGTDSQYNIGSSSVRFANIYADTLYGDGSNLTGIDTDLVFDTSPQLGGPLNTNSQIIKFPDSNGSTNQAIFGTDSDLKILHDGSNSFITESGTGDLHFTTTGGAIKAQKNTGENMIIANVDGSVELYHDNTKMLQTTSFGAEVIYSSSSPDTPILKVLHGNLSQGLGLGYHTISAIGSNANVDLKLKSKGTSPVGLYHGLNLRFATTDVGVRVPDNGGYFDINGGYYFRGTGGAWNMRVLSTNTGSTSIFQVLDHATANILNVVQDNYVHIDNPYNFYIGGAADNNYTTSDGIRFMGFGGTTARWFTNTFDNPTGGNTPGPYLYNRNASHNGVRFYVRVNGGVVNHSGNNSNLCDERMKKNIVDAPSYWNSIKNIGIKKFNYNSDPEGTPLQVGVIAQQVETIESDLVDDDFAVDGNPNEEGATMMKSVHEEQLFMMAVKALQEAQARIETLEAEVAALKGS